MRKTEDLALLTDSEISQRLVKVAKRVPQAFGALVFLSLTSTVFGFTLNNNGLSIAGGAVSLVGALIVICGAFYMRKLRKENDSLIEVSNSRRII